MTIFLRTLENKTLALNLNPNSTSLETLQLTIEQKSGTPINLQRIFLSGRRLIGTQNSEKTLINLGIQSNSYLSLEIPVLGGMQAPVAPKPRLEFLSSKPPPNYVAGLGRGATGFTTRSDIGTAARIAPGLPGGVGRGRGKGKEDEGGAEYDDADEEKGYDENQAFDEFEGNDLGLLGTSAEDDDDIEADRVWKAIDERMESRKKDKKEAKLKQEIKEFNASNLKITEQFSDLKRKLETVSAEEWDSIPEAVELTKRIKTRRFESFVPVPDTGAKTCYCFGSQK